MPAREYVTTGRVEHGKLKVRKWEQLVREFRRWRDGEVLITIERAHATRSLQANAWYWSQILGLLSEHTGHTPEELHTYFKRRFNAKPMCLVNAAGEVVDGDAVGMSTTTLNTLTFSEYCERIRSVAGDLGVVIPDPDPDWRNAGERA